ncbi:Glutamine--fructose-6-phosphate aminotransferase [isomerizing] [hydrothermal vent metagenome]|uniref:Glutamine--fructose-6-phosphate aminotransferase [isomerizing] n=1 Tax=hydrothermal vent metagenome TaxID=652676 RepID=A0A3B1DSG0_9ZZZZ
MCGIVGYTGKRNSLPVLVDGLKRLEYRGYDSAGIAFQNGNGIEIYKTKGKIKDLQKILPHPTPDAMVGLGHTRWATHGVPSSRNAHPHRADGIAVVHNGIIENYRNLRSHLIAEGHKFSSDTDTEVIPQMISSYLQKKLPVRDAIKETIAHLRGSFAIGIMNEAHPNTLFSIRKGSPLVIGIGDGEFFFASDVSALLPYTRRFIFMEDGQICTLGREGIELQYLDSQESTPVEEQAVEIDWTPSMAEKKGYNHFMLKEIHEQPSAMMDTIREWTDDPERILDEFGLTVRRTIGLNKLQIVACGTSYHAALVGKYMIEDIARIPVDVEIASEYRYKSPIIEHDSLLISITQSGETADTLAAQREAKKRGARTLTICNVVGSTSSREADSVLYTRTGPEIGVASTKAFTAQIGALCLLSIALGIRTGRLTPGEAGTLRSQLLKIPAFMEKTLKMNSGIEELAGTLIYSKTFLYLGRGINYPIALEGALKLKEISYIPATGYPAGEMKHGPIALIEEGLPVVVIAPVDNLFEKTLSNIEEVKARGGRVIAITDEPESLRDKVDDLIVVPSAHSSLSPLVNVIPLQLLAYYIGILKGCDVDQPRNLAKSVTVE